jgi:hypothetical protein
MHAILIAGAALVGLPILLHLIMKQEPKRLTFPAFRFLKQKLKTNQRKLRLRHFILLALRMLLIALFCLTLYQPTFKSDRLNIRGEQPVAVVLIIDTTPSMGYMVNNETRLAEAQRRARELLKELPDKSPVAILDTADTTGSWLPVGDVGAANRRIDELKDTRSGQPVNAVIAVAYQLLAKVDQEMDAPEPMPRLVVVFTDRTVASWDPARTEDLKKLRETVPDPKPVHVVIDFGADQPSNVSILGAEMKPQVIGANQTAHVDVSVGAVGSDRPIEVTVQAKLDGSGKTENKVVTVAPGQARSLAFEFRDLKPGLHQVEFALAAPDKLAFDNSRFLTFKVGESRRILTITDDRDGAAFWQASHVATDEFACLVVTPDQVVVGNKKEVNVLVAADPQKPNDTHPEDLRSFEVVCLLNVDNPNAPNPNRPNDGSLWDRLLPYAQTGGKLIVMPGPDTTLKPEGYNTGTADLIMPGKLKGVIETRKMNPPPPPQPASSWPAPRDGKNGVTWVLDDKALRHPMLKIIDSWKKQKANLDITANPRVTRKFWELDANKAATAVVYYLDNKDPAKQHPAVLERRVLDPNDGNKPKGKVLLLTTRMDVDEEQEEAKRWNNYWELESSWFAAFPYLLVRYLAGDTADANFNFPTGATVAVPLPRGRMTPETQLNLDGPSVSGNDAKPNPGEKQMELRIGPPLSSVPGNFALSLVGPDRNAPPIWRDGFSTNVPPEESNLEKVPVEEIEKLTDKDRVFSIDRNSTLHDWLDIALGQPVDLFPWLLLAVLALFVLEGLVANRFYRRPK